MINQVLIAGIGNIFLGDDAFGCEVAHVLSDSRLPAHVRVVDFGIRGLDLAYALLDPWQAVIMVDALPRGHAPGTLYLIEPDLAAICESGTSQPAMDAHNMDPAKVLRLAAVMGGVNSKIYVLGCEPEDCGGEEGRMGLSLPVAAAIPEALRMIDELIGRICSKDFTGVAENSFAR